MAPSQCRIFQKQMRTILENTSEKIKPRGGHDERLSGQCKKSNPEGGHDENLFRLY
jgi:hypothetical protein